MKLWLKQGPYKIVKDEECLCQNNSKGLKCNSCVSGFFNLDDSCTRLVQRRKNSWSSCVSKNIVLVWWTEEIEIIAVDVKEVSCIWSVLNTFKRIFMKVVA